jgi:alkylhydroperoxidase family enzyme
MRLKRPRIEPVDLDRLDQEQSAAIEPILDLQEDKVGRGRVLNIFKTFLHAPKALRAFLGWGNYILSRRSALPEREREMVILRTGWNCRSGYEFAQHARIGKDCGLTDADIAWIKQGPEAEGWSALESAMLRAADELHADQFVSEQTWNDLAELGDKGRMDLVFTVGQYTQVSMMLNSFGIQLEDGDQPDPDLDHTA